MIDIKQGRLLAANAPRRPWRDDDYDSRTWIDSADDTSVVRYASCGSHEADWADGAKELVLWLANNLDELLDLAEKGAKSA